MFRRILVAVDKLSVSRAAYDRAIVLAKAFNAKVMIFHALFEHEAGSPEIPVTLNLPYATDLNDVLREHYRQQWKTFETEYINYLRWMAEEAKLDGIDADFAIAVGDPGRSICDIAREWHADVVVTGSQGKSALTELLLGSVSNYVNHHAPCNVLVVHQGDNDSAQPNVVSDEVLASTY